MLSRKQLKKLSDEAKNDKLYSAIMLNDTAGAARLKEQGAELSGHIRYMLINGAKSGEEGNYSYRFNWRGKKTRYNIYSYDLHHFYQCLSEYQPEEFIRVVRELYKELGAPIYFSSKLSNDLNSPFYNADAFRCVLECFDTGKINKLKTITNIISVNNTEMLEIAAEHGWIRTSRNCDKYIELANEKGQTECAAFLMDYKNRAFDAALEREKAEKRRLAELNAAPDSVTFMKKLWRYRPLRDGNSVKITHYKGSDTDITVPPKIGNMTVTALELIFSKTGSKCKPFVNFFEHVTRVTLPDSLVTIGSNVFQYYSSLREVIIPEGVENIGKDAFLGCSSLSGIILPDSLKEIGAGAFCSSGLERIKLPDRIEALNEKVFVFCERLREVVIPGSVKVIGEGAFGYCKELESIIIPDGVTEIGDAAFIGCERLMHVELPSTLRVISRGAFMKCCSLKELVIPEGVREIGERAFAECKALERVVLPASLEKIFISEAYNLKSVVREKPHLQTIFDIPFSDTVKVTAVVTPGSLAEEYCRQHDVPFEYKE